MLQNVLMVLFHAFILVTVASFTKSAKKTDPEVFMNTSQLITSKGYPCEEYDVHTHDRYILGVQRIPHGIKPPVSNTSRPVVLLQHPLLSCSACWVENLRNESLGFLLADAGFDVWLGNNRGNTYSKRHETLDPNSKEFWAFSWDERAMYDIPNTVDFIIKKTGVKQIFYVGHSQGGAIGFAQLSRDKDLESKIKMFVGMAPAVYIDNNDSPLKYLEPIASEMLYLLFGYKDFLPSSELIRWLGREFCAIPMPQILCENIMFVIAGYDAQQMNATRLPVYVAQNPAGTSTQNMVHYVQASSTPIFQMYDYGHNGNMKKYNQTSPPKYNIEQIQTPIVLYSGTADKLVTPNSINRLVPKIKNLVKHKVVQGWEHLDFMWAMDAPAECYNDVISQLKMAV